MSWAELASFVVDHIIHPKKGLDLAGHIGLTAFGLLAILTNPKMEGSIIVKKTADKGEHYNMSDLQKMLERVGDKALENPAFLGSVLGNIAVLILPEDAALIETMESADLLIGDRVFTLYDVDWLLSISKNQINKVLDTQKMTLKSDFSDKVKKGTKIQKGKFIKSENPEIISK